MKEVNRFLPARKGPATVNSAQTPPEPPRSRKNLAPGSPPLPPAGYTPPTSARLAKVAWTTGSQPPLTPTPNCRGLRRLAARPATLNMRHLEASWRITSRPPRASDHPTFSWTRTVWRHRGRAPPLPSPCPLPFHSPVWSGGQVLPIKTEKSILSKKVC